MSRANRMGRRPAVPVSPEVMDRAVADLMRRPWVDVATYAALFGVGLSAAYRDAREGRFGAFKIGVQFRFPAVPIREALGLQAGSPIPAEHAAEAA